MDRQGRTAAAIAIAAVHTAAIVARAPLLLTNGLCQLSSDPGRLGPATANGAAGSFCSPRNPLRIRSGVNGGSRKRTPVASKIALAIAAALGTEADSPTPSGG